MRERERERGRKTERKEGRMEEGRKVRRKEGGREGRKVQRAGKNGREGGKGGMEGERKKKKTKKNLQIAPKLQSHCLPHLPVHSHNPAHLVALAHNKPLII